MALSFPPLILANGEMRQYKSGDILNAILGNRSFNDIYELFYGEVGTLPAGSICYFDGATTSMKKAKADAITNCSGVLWIALQAITSGGTGLFQMSGILDVFSSLTTGIAYYLSPTTAGAITSIIPSTVGQCIVKLGTTMNTNIIFFKIERPIILA